MSTHDVGAVSDVPMNGCLAMILEDRPVVVVRAGAGVYALENRCTHADVALSEGEIADGTIECWLHGSAFDLETGEPLTPPATQPVETFPVTIQGDGADARILVSLSRGPDDASEE